LRARRRQADRSCSQWSFDSLAAAEEITERVSKLAEVARVVTLATFIPGD
jgi:hypothetical protein